MGVSRRCPTAPSIPTGSAPSPSRSAPRSTGAGDDGANLAEATLCVMAREPRARVEPPGRRDARPVAVAIAVDRSLGALEGDLKIAAGPPVAGRRACSCIVPAGSARSALPHRSRACRSCGASRSREVAPALPVLCGGLGDASLARRGSPVALGADGEAGSPGCRRIIVCPTNVIVQARWLRALADHPSSRRRSRSIRRWWPWSTPKTPARSSPSRRARAPPTTDRGPRRPAAAASRLVRPARPIPAAPDPTTRPRPRPGCCGASSSTARASCRATSSGAISLAVTRRLVARRSRPTR